MALPMPEGLDALLQQLETALQTHQFEQAETIDQHIRDWFDGVEANRSLADRADWARVVYERYQQLILAMRSEQSAQATSLRLQMHAVKALRHGFLGA